jgi:ABC-type Na+ efflux pump permease subunit
MDKHLGKYDEAGLAFAREALEAADIEYSVSDDSVGARYSMSLGRMEEARAMYDVYVEEARFAQATAAVGRWQKEAEEAARRESGAAPPTPEELAADAEWEREQKEEKDKAAADAKRPSPLVPALIALAIVIVVTVLLAFYAQSHAAGM